MKLNELLHKKVISVDGKELGLINDMELDQCLCVKTIYVCEIKRGIARFLPWLFNDCCEKITVEQITNIGEDVILVKKERVFVDKSR